VSLDQTAEVKHQPDVVHICVKRSYVSETLTAHINGQLD
jgi:hypothetical protein